MKLFREIFLCCAALALSAGCAARAGGGVFIPGPEDDAGAQTSDVVTAMGDGGGVACTPPEFNCGGACVNLLTSVANCGMCGRACAGGSVCQMGQCVAAPSCAAPQMLCGGTCVDTQSNAANCGACGNACAAGQSCVNGSCAGGMTCNAPEVLCAGRCVNVRTDSQNCGVCGIACASGQSCSNGVCVGGEACVAPRMTCGGACVDVLSSPQHCGFCNRACASGQTCSSGSCVGGGGCTAPNISCGGVCVNPLNNAQNCGSCLNACAAGQSCSNGVCTGGSGGGNAGRACSGESDTSCGGTLSCLSFNGQFLCTAACTNSTSQSTERSQCGGTSSTCLILDGMTGDGFCTATCTAGGGTCRSGYACSQRALFAPAPDTAGCIPFCRTNSNCAAGQVCNLRTGVCGAAPFNPSRLADGSACNPSITELPPGETTPRNTQCRGLCLRVTEGSTTQGICGSLINLAVTTTCPDPGVDPRGSMSDEVGICVFRDCTRNADCGAGLRCIYPERMGVPDRTLTPICSYASSAQPNGIP